MADGTRSLFESGDGLEQALHTKRQIAQAEAAQLDHLIDYLLEWCDDPVATASCAAAGERVWQYGGSGTPEIPEFGVCEVASALGMSPNGAGIFTGDILDIRYRLPRLDGALHRGQVDAWRVRKVASATRQFTIAQAAEADRRLSAETVGDGTPMLGRASMARLRPHIAHRTQLPRHRRNHHQTRPTPPPTNQRGITAGATRLGGHSHARAAAETRMATWIVPVLSAPEGIAPDGDMDSPGAVRS